MQAKDLTAKYAALAVAIEAKLGAQVERLPTSTGELGYRVAAEDLLAVGRALRDTPELKFEMLMDVCGVDYQDYGRDEWQTNSATGTGFSRGTLGAGVEAPADDVAPVTYRPGGRFAVVYHLITTACAYARFARATNGRSWIPSTTSGARRIGSSARRSISSAFFSAATRICGVC
jgi:NADH:ubiquinone oxidoreductase subunit C